MPRQIPRRLALLSLAHFSIDGYSSFVPPLLPLLIAKLHLSLTMVGVLLAASSVSSSFSQPLFGWIADRLHRPWFVAFGPLVAAIFLSSVGVASSYGMLMALMFLGGLGAAAFHPQGATLAIETAKRRGLALSTFVSSGTLGFSLGPIFAVSTVAAVGLERTWIAAIPGLVIAALLLFWFQQAAPRAQAKGPRPTLSELRPVARPLTLLYFCVVFRSAASFGFMTFLPIWLNNQGASIQTGGLVLTAYLAAGALGGFFGGWLSERVGGRRVVIQSFLGALPLYYGFVLLHGPAGIVSLVLGSFVLQGSLPVNVVLGQELSPRHSSTIASLLMGAAWGFGMLLVSPTGALADAHGLRIALGCLAVTLVGGLACALALPDIRRVPVSVPPDFIEPAVAVEAS
jgi:MFS transporter, FSR family, fosmidomycin resistance protein